MNKNLGWKLGLVFATLLFFLFGIFGIPKGFSGRSLLTSLQDRIHLGLDLKGGTHLILQVQGAGHYSLLCKIAFILAST